MKHASLDEWIERADMGQLRAFVEAHCEIFVSPHEAKELSRLIMQSFRLHIEAAPLVLRDRAGLWHQFSRAQGRPTTYLEQARLLGIHALEVNKP